MKKLMQELLAESSLKEAKGVEVFTIHNMSGVPKKFRQVDGTWEKPTEAKAWMKSHEYPKNRKAEREAIKRQKDWEKEDRKAEREEKKKPKIDLQKVYNKVIEVIGNVFPDGDPIDNLAPWFERQGLDGYEIGETIEAAMKKHGSKSEKKGMYAYMGDLWDEMTKDAMYDAKTMQAKGKRLDSPFVEYEKDVPVARDNPWK
jgi:hypothetical protein